MKSRPNTQQFPVYRIGEVALDLLKPGSQGRILTVFSKAIYLQTLCGNLFWLVTDTIPMHRRAIQIQGALPRVVVDSSFHVKGQRLLLEPDIDLDLSPASIWVSPPPNNGRPRPFEDLADRLWTITRLAGDWPSPRGFGRILLQNAQIGIDRSLPAEFPDDGPILNHARPALDEIVRAAIANDYPQILRTSKDLIGLGEGLTPSGDDLIGGLLFSNFVLQQSYAQYQGFTRSDVASFVLDSRDRTNHISYTMLQDLASGHTFDTLHRFMNAFLTDRHLENAHNLALELVRIGHSTGWDLLTGVWTTIYFGTSSRSAPSKGVPELTSCPQ